MKLRGWLCWGLAALALVATGAGYLQPGLMIQISEQLWSCFG